MKIKTVAVVIATYNRGPSLAITLESLSRVIVPVGVELRVRVVDNASDPPVSGNFRSSDYPGLNLELLHEPRRGKSCALNRGLADLSADLIAFTDDDMYVHPEWLAEAVAHFESCRCDGMQGGVRIRSTRPLPVWFTRKCAQLLGGTDELEPGVSLKSLNGGNMLVKGSKVHEGGPFREDLGPHGHRIGYSEDVEWSHRLWAGGAVFCYCPGALLDHLVEPERLRRRYIVRRQFDISRTECVLDGENEPALRRWRRSELGENVRQLLGCLVRRKYPPGHMDYWLELAHRAGRICGLIERKN